MHTKIQQLTEKINKATESEMDTFMSDYASFRKEVLHMTTLKSIWERRKNLLKHKTWDGTDPKSGFDLESWNENSCIAKYKKNFMDLSIRDFRDVLTALQQGEFPETLSTSEFQVQVFTTHPFALFALTPKETSKRNITIIANGYAQQAQFTIYVDEAVYSVSWYKNRGSIDSIINTEYGQPITLEELTDILVELGLESPYNDIDTESDT